MNKLSHINKMASLYRYATLLCNINHNLFICILVSLVLPSSERASAKVYGGQHNSDSGDQRLTKEYHLRQGVLRGLIVQPGRQYELQSVEMFLGIPYAAPPVENLRFMPPGSALPWSGVRQATEFAPVCPQSLPPVHKDNPPSAGRQQYMKRLQPFLTDESEDCLYLNIYVPKQEHKTKKFPVLVFIHGDSFEWSSGNPYDGRILASYGSVMVVTINFRLGILGFMKPSLTEHVYGNNGLLDQLAALQWIKDNIAVLNGDPDSVTLMGHGTGAACVNFLMMSPISNGLFHRAILMSGSALSDWALTRNPLQYTVQAAQYLNCSVSGSGANIMACLQNKRLSDIKKVQILARRFTTPLGPAVAGSFIPNEPARTMDSYPNIFSKYELLSGVTELESYHEFGVIALAHGVLETERDDLLAQYAEILYAAPDIAAADIMQEYSPMRIDPQRWGVNANRDFILDVLSDARTVAPLVLTAGHHARANPRSFFYVFGHNSEHTDYAALSKSVHGEEVPYVLGVPLGGARTHFHEEYTAKERLLSEAVMRLWSNFVKRGTPNSQRIGQYLTLNSEDWNHYNIDWPEFTVEHQSYLRIDVPPSNFVRSFYRANYTKFWNEVLPSKMKNYAVSPLFEYEPVHTTPRTRKVLPTPATVEHHNRKPPSPQRPQVSVPAYGRPRQYVPQPPSSYHDDIYKTIKAIKTPARSVPSDIVEDPLKRRDFHSTKENVQEPTTELPIKSSSTTISIIIVIGCIFLAVNIAVFATLYIKKRRLQDREREIKRENTSNGENTSDFVPKRKGVTSYETFKNRCNAIKTLKWNKINQSDDMHKKVKLNLLKTPKSDDSGGFEHRFKLRRHLSSSTIDANTKVRDWIASEIINRCTPPITRKANLNIEVETKHRLSNEKKNTQLDDINDALITSPSKSQESLKLSVHKGSNSTISTKKSTNKNERKNVSEKTVSTSAHGSHSSVSNSKDDIKRSQKTVTSKSNDSLANSEGKKSNKVSIAVDATPAARNSEILRQKPIELSKSIDIVENIPHESEILKVLKRSKTENDAIDQIALPGSICNTSENQNNPTYTSIFNLSLNDKNIPKTNSKLDVIKISHKHSASDPIKDLNYDAILQYTEFHDIPPPSIFRNDINVTSRDETKNIKPLTAAEALLTIQRRNYPKVLPDLPNSLNNNYKRLSLQPNSFQSFRSYINSEPKDNASLAKIPPQPPPRTTSTLDRRIGFQNSKKSGTSSFDSGKSFNSIGESTIIHNDNYCNIDVISSIYSDANKNICTNTSPSIKDSYEEIDSFNKPVVKRELPKVIIAATDIPNMHEPKIIIKQSIEKSLAEIQTNAPRVRLPDSFHSISTASERSGSSLSTIYNSDVDLEDEVDDYFSEAKLIEALVGGIDTNLDADEIPDAKGPDNSFEKKLEIIPVKLNNTPVPSIKNYEHFKYSSNDLLPDVSDLEKTAQIKQKFSLNKLQNRSESINQPMEKAVNLKNKKIQKTPIFSSKSNKDKTSSLISKPGKHKTENKKKFPIEHSYSGSSNDTESSTGTVKKVELKK